MRVDFQPLTTGNVSKKGDTINGDLRITGKLGVGFAEETRLRSRLSIAPSNGSLISFEDQLGKDAWRISQGSGNTPSLSITDDGRNGLTILKGGKIGIGTTNIESSLHLNVQGSASPISAMAIDVHSFGTPANAQASHFFRVRDIWADPPNGKTPFTIRGDGNVAIGEVTPSANEFAGSR